MTKGLRFDDEKALAAFLAGKQTREGNKYGAVAETREGIRHDSKAEANFADELRLQERRGEIKDLVLDKDLLRYPLVVNGVMVGTYTADFRYTTKVGQVIVGEVKSKATKARADYRLRRKLMLACHGIAVMEIVR